MNTRIRSLRNATLALVAMVLVAGCKDTPEKMLASAKDHLAKNDRSAAVIELRNALQKKPDLAEARFLLGKSLAETNDLAGAEKELLRAQELEYPANVVIPVLARVYVKRGEYKQVLDFANAKLGSAAERADLQTSLGQAHLGLGDTVSAQGAFTAALAAQADYPPALTGQARLLATTGDVAGGLALLDKTLEKAPGLSEGWQLKGDLLLSQAKVDEAIAAYRKAFEARPDLLPARYMTVSLLVQQGKVEESRKELEAMQKIAPRSPQTYYLQALLAFRDQNYTAARDAIQLNLKGAPNNPLGLLLSAQIDYRLGSYAQAQSALAQVLQRAPKHTSARRLLVQAYLREGRPAKALEALQPLLQDTGQDSDTLSLAGEVYAQNGDHRSAAFFFEKAAALDPKNASKRTNVALSHLVKGDNERGLAELQTIAADDKGIRADLAIAVSSVQRKKYDDALAAVDAIEKKQPDNPLAHDLRGSILVQKGDTAKARQSFEKALAIDPLYISAAQNLARLDLADKKPADAKKRFEAILAKDPKNVQAMLALANLNARAGALPDDVAKMIANAVAANPADSTPRIALIAHYLQSREPKKAITAAQEAMTALPDRPEILAAASKAYSYAGDLNQAIAINAKLLQLRPDSVFTLLSTAELQVANKEVPAAMATVRKALELEPNNFEAQRAMVALNATTGRPDEAIKAARAIQKTRPTESIGYVLEGNVYAAKKAWTEAAGVYRNGLKYAPTTDLAERVYTAYVAGGKSADADAFAASWVKDHPKDSVFRHRVAQVALAKKDYPAAAKHYKALVDNEEKDAIALNNLAWVAGQLNDPKAVEYAERADKLAPGNPVIMDTYGVLLVEKGEAARGVELLQKAVALSPNAGEIRLNLARALIKTGKKDAAKTELETLAKMGNKFGMQAEVSKLLQTL